ncbi:MAG: ComEA family DNA-binding protein [Motiliproteus sp.]
MIMNYIVRSVCSAIVGIYLLSSVAFALEQVNINTADASSLAKLLSGVGDAKAAEIVRYREQNGPFGRVEQLAEVKGIGKALVQRNFDRIRLSSETK